MAERQGPGLLSHLPNFAGEGGDVLVVIETPKGSPNKYDYDDNIAAFRLAGVMPEGTAFPYDFGFVPSTLGEDGDPLDVLVLMDSPIPVGCVLQARLIGAIRARQRPEGGDWRRNDRLLAVATKARTHAHVQGMGDLRPGMVEEVEAFFGHYNEMNGRNFEPLGRCGPEEARDLVRRGAEAFRQAEAKGAG
jgi:inorganic pyrophosphatase